MLAVGRQELHGSHCIREQIVIVDEGDVRSGDDLACKEIIRKCFTKFNQSRNWGSHLQTTSREVR